MTKKKPDSEKAPKISWVNMDGQILAAIEGLKESGYKFPTIRSVYYVLGTQNVIPLTDGGYKRLDAKIVEMRKEGSIPWGYFAVKRGTSSEAPAFWSGEEWANHWINRLRRAKETFHLPRWYGQPNLVEVWVEKDGLLGAVANWLSDLEVTVRAPQGYGAWEFIRESLVKIQEELGEQKKEEIHILYAGDLDPSGKDIPRFMEQEAIAYFEDELGVHVEFREIALSPEQVHKFHLPQQPGSAEVLAKIHRDPRLGWYRAHYPPNLFVELDAFFALATKDAKALIRSEVMDLFDDETYEASRIIEEEMREIVGKEISKSVKFLPKKGEK